MSRGGTVTLDGGLRGSPNPFKRVVATLDNGTIVRALDFTPGTLIRDDMTYRFTPTKCGVTYEFPARAGDTIEYSIFLRRADRAPRVSARGVSDADARWTLQPPGQGEAGARLRVRTRPEARARAGHVREPSGRSRADLGLRRAIKAL